MLTPHAGEFARLSGEGTVKEIERVTRLRRFVERTGVTTLLKGRSTLIDDGTTLHVNTTGTSTLATAGTGDVLTGMIATLLSQGLAAVDAARCAAYWHGLAGKFMSFAAGPGVTASDIVDAIRFAPAIRHLGADGRHGGLQQVLDLDRKVADADAGRMIDGCGNRGRDPG